MRNSYIVLIIIITLLSTGQTIAVEYGDAYLVGTTWWTAQTNSTVGKTIVRDENGRVHFVWTKGLDQELAQRHIYFNWVMDGEGEVQAQLDENGDIVDAAARAGYAALDVIERGEGFVTVAFYHITGSGMFSVDFAPGWGAFDNIALNAPDRMQPFVVKGSVGRNGRLFAIAGIHDMMSAYFPLVAWSATHDQNFNWRVNAPLSLERTTGLSHLVKSSAVSDRVALAWHHNIPGVPAPDDWEGSTAYTMNNDIYILLSPDGVQWNLNNPLNITRTIPDDAQREGWLAYGDTLRPFNDLDMIWVGDVLHIVFSVRGLWLDIERQRVPPVERITTKESLIWHWDSESDSLTLVANGWYENAGNLGALYNNVARPSLAVNAEGVLYCIFRQAIENDRGNDDYCYGDILLTLSRDNGVTWTEAVNITGTRAENPVARDEYVDEQHPSLAERVDENLHIHYLLAIENQGLTGEARMIYQRVPVDSLPDLDPLSMPRQDFQYHNRPSARVREAAGYGIPADYGFCLCGPNPFNGIPVLQFSLTRSKHTRLLITDQTGRIVDELLNAELAAGTYRREWPDAANATSGIYWGVLQTSTGKSTVKMILMR